MVLNRVRGFPALFAPASLKLPIDFPLFRRGFRFSGAFCAGLIEATTTEACCSPCAGFSGAFCAGLIEARDADREGVLDGWFSGAFCAGLIEAEHSIVVAWPRASRFPALFAPASLKPSGGDEEEAGPEVFRRFLRRPH